MNYIEKDFGKILKHNALQMRRLMLRNGTDCMRVYDRNLEDLPVTVDLYGPYVRITDYSEDGLDEDVRRVCCDIAARMLYVQADHVVFHQRKKRQGREQHEILSDESLMVQVKENGLLFSVDLTRRIDTGLFLDHVETRAMVRDLSAGMSVLNLFAYTGAFSVYAASGGAKRVVSVDMSATYSKWCEDNLRSNGFVGFQYPCIAEDAWKHIRRAVKEGEKFDLIVFDPPSFSNSRKMEHDFDVQRDHVRWVRMLNRLLTRDGILLFSTNLGTFRMDKRSIRGYDVQEITSEVAAPGFSKQRGCTRSWILKKEHEVQIPAEDLREPEVPVTAATDAGEETAKTVKKPRKASKKKVQEVPEEEKQVEVEKKDETPEEVAVVEEAAEEVNVVEDDEVVEQELDQDEVVADDLLSLDWNEEDEVSDSDDQDSAEGVQPVERVSERRSDRDRDERPRRDRRDDDRRDSRSGDRGRDGRGSYGDRRPSYGDRDRGPRRDNDDRRSYGDRDSRPRYNDDRRPSYGDRDSRPRYNDDRRPSYGDRDSRPRYNDDRRPSYGDRDRGPRRDDDRRSSYGDRDSRPRYNDDRRPSYGDRDRGPRRDNDRRPSYGDRDSRPRYNDDRRPSYGDRDSRPRRDSDDRRPSYGDRDSRPRFNDDRRPSYGDRDRAPRRDNDDRRSSYGDRDRGRRDDKPYGRRDDSDRGFKPRRYDDNGGDRRPWGDRPQRDGGFRRDAGSRKEGGFRRDDRNGSDSKPRTKGPKPYGFDHFKETRTRGQEEDSNFFWLSDDEKK